MCWWIFDPKLDTVQYLPAKAGLYEQWHRWRTTQKTDRNGNPNVFNLKHNADGLWLNNNWVNPTNKWNPDNELMFRLRKFFFSVRLGETVFLLGIF